MDLRTQNCQLESAVSGGGGGGGGGDGGSTTPAPDRVSEANGEGVPLDPLRQSSSWSSPHSTGKSPLTKGFGLRKWRRVRRGTNKEEASVNSDSIKALKRGAPTLVAANNRPATDSKAVADPSEDSVGSVNMSVHPGAGVDSDNSDDRSSRSSTAASAPRSRYDQPTVVKEKSKIKNYTSGKNASGGPVLRVPQGKGRLDASKKARGEWIRIETENSLSSIESDSRSSNFVFTQGACSATSNGNQSRVSMSYGGENGDDVLAEEHEYSEEVLNNRNHGNDEENEDYLRDDLAVDASWDQIEDNGGIRQSTADCDPVVELIRDLQSLHEVLVSEVHKFGELGRENIGSRVFNPEVDEPSSSNQFGSQTNGQSLEIQVAGLTEKVKELEIRLEDAKELESEVEDLYKQKIEAEIEKLAVVKSVQKLKVAVGDPITLLNEQKTLVCEQVAVMNKLGKTECKVALLKEQAEELQKNYGDMLQIEEEVKVERRVCKVASCFSIQLILLFLVVWLLMTELYPESVVPT